MAGEFWLGEAQWGALGPLLPRNQPGARRTDDRRVISGVVHVLKTGCRWQDCPAVYGPSTTVYNRFRRWMMRGIWRRLFDALARADPGDGQAIDSTTAKAHRSAAGEKEGGGAGDWSLARRAHHKNPRHRRCARTPHRHRSDAWPSRRRSCRDSANQRRSSGGCLAADTAYDSDGLRRFLLQRGTVPVIPNNPARKRHHPFDETAYRQRNLIERMFCRLKDWRRIATRYDKLAANFAAAVMIAAVIIWWT
jgi:transposase